MLIPGLFSLLSSRTRGLQPRGGPTHFLPSWCPLPLCLPSSSSKGRGSTSPQHVTRVPVCVRACGLLSHCSCVTPTIFFLQDPIFPHLDAHPSTVADCSHLLHRCRSNITNLHGTSLPPESCIPLSYHWLQILLKCP